MPAVDCPSSLNAWQMKAFWKYDEHHTRVHARKITTGSIPSNDAAASAAFPPNTAGNMSPPALTKSLTRAARLAPANRSSLHCISLNSTLDRDEDAVVVPLTACPMMGPAIWRLKLLEHANAPPRAAFNFGDGGERYAPPLFISHIKHMNRSNISTPDTLDPRPKTFESIFLVFGNCYGQCERKKPCMEFDFPLSFPAK